MSETLRRKANLLLGFATLLLENGSDSPNIERCLRRITHALGGGEMVMHLSLRTVTISLSEGDATLTLMRKAIHHAVNMTVLSAVGRTTLKLDGASLESLEAELERMRALPHHYPSVLVIVAVAAACAAFCRVFGGGLFDLVATFFGAAAGLSLRRPLLAAHVNRYLIVSATAFVSTVVAGLCASGFALAAPRLPLVASILYLIPGVPLINAADDTTEGYTVTGMSRALVSLFIVGSIGLGAALGLSLLQRVSSARLSWQDQGTRPVAYEAQA